MTMPTVEELSYINQWAMLVYRFTAGLCMIPVAIASIKFIMVTRGPVEIENVVQTMVME